MINIAKPIIGEEEIKAVTNVLNSGILAQGKNISEFEENFAKYVDSYHGIATSSGTTALHAALLAHGIGNGDEVITSPFSFIATANSILAVGAKPIFVDIDKNNFNINPDLIQEKINKKTKAVMSVSLFGLTPDMDKISKIVSDNKLILIEDNAQAHGAEFKGKKAGSFGTACFSFYPTKNMTTSEGGIITTNNKDVADKARMIISHGSKIRYQHDIFGYNFRMTSLAAALGLVQLKKLDEFNKKRIENANYLIKNLNNLNITLPVAKENYKHVYHQFTIMVENRDEVLKKLHEKEIKADIFYPKPIYEQPFYKNLGYTGKNLEVSQEVCKKVLSLYFW